MPGERGGRRRQSRGFAQFRTLTAYSARTRGTPPGTTARFGPASAALGSTGDVRNRTNEWDALTANRARRARTGGPGDRYGLLENILGWTLVVVLAMFVTQAGLM
ncbi:SCO1431 family membrane protein [Streptomyces sp. NBC_01433]|uniref:SCO1431 family membrane protein n=1 Tax=Streptomyces sp. NBC_01433 TaxID=2903864 RepID=UPI00225B383C|nr:SCO1431 family membrane protein [Streptomyces sp. NBC_01433]MCX4678633.1 SCO1431 family membrane protein [Streptomyces sp. NBC_01433]